MSPKVFSGRGPTQLVADGDNRYDDKDDHDDHNNDDDADDKPGQATLEQVDRQHRAAISSRWQRPWWST